MAEDKELAEKILTDYHHGLHDGLFSVSQVLRMAGLSVSFLTFQLTSSEEKIKAVGLSQHIDNIQAEVKEKIMSLAHECIKENNET